MSVQTKQDRLAAQRSELERRKQFLQTELALVEFELQEIRRLGSDTRTDVSTSKDPQPLPR